MSQQRPESASDPRLIRMADYYDTWSTRDRARAFNPDLLERLEDAPSWGEIVISFEDVSFVSPPSWTRRWCGSPKTDLTWRSAL